MRLLSAFIIGMGLLILALVTKGRLGGADVKLMMAAALSLGLTKSIIALLAGALLAVFTEGVLEHNRGRFALIPYLAVGILGQLVI